MNGTTIQRVYGIAGLTLGGLTLLTLGLFALVLLRGAPIQLPVVPPVDVWTGGYGIGTAGCAQMVAQGR